MKAIINNDFTKYLLNIQWEKNGTWTVIKNRLLITIAKASLSL